MIKSVLLTAVLAGSLNAFASSGQRHTDHSATTASSHAPIGVMGDHRHERGGWMLSYRYMRMEMSGNRVGTHRVSPEDIVIRYANPFFGMPMQPPTFRVVPVDMSMDMHMIGAMIAPTDRVTLMAMTKYVSKEMDHVTFAGANGTTRLGRFTTRSEGLGDTTLSALIGLMTTQHHTLQLNIGLSLPTGSLDKTDQILTPTGTTPSVRLPYAMHLGSGTFDLQPGLTYNGRQGSFAWGGQITATIRLDDNDEGYALGDRYAATLWGARDWSPNFSTSLRVSASTQDSIERRDLQIMGPVQTADPNNYGGETVDAFVGVNIFFGKGSFKGNRLALEVGAPLHRDINGPQMDADWTLTIGWQRAFH